MILTECWRDQICCRHIWRDKWGPPTELLPPSHIYGTLVEVLAIPVVNKELNEFSDEDFCKIDCERIATYMYVSLLCIKGDYQPL